MKVVRRLIFLFVILYSQSALAQQDFSPYYVVIGGFKSEQNAQQFCLYAHEQNLPALYAFNEERAIFYVYVRATQTKDVADEIRARLKTNTVFRDAWVFNGVLSGADAMTQRSSPPVEKKPASEPEPQEQPQVEAIKETETKEIEAEEPPQAPEQDEEAEEAEEAQSGAVPESSEAVAETSRPAGNPFVFKLVNEETGSVVGGTVRLQENDKARQFRGFNANEKVYVPAPSNRTGKWLVVCHVLGYRHLKKVVGYENAAEVEGASLGPDSEVIIPLGLERVRRGDYVEMENVKFFNNTALFTPGSERELDELVAMMEENPRYHIRLHGHANGKQSRDIVSLGTSTDMFNPDVSNAKTYASAKELSLLRAELVKTYLVGKGIDGSRISTKGEGGAQMIFDPKGTLAGLNDRVEVEILKH